MERVRNRNAGASLYTFGATTLAVAGSVMFLDEPISLAVGRLMQSHGFLARYGGNLPDLLLPAVLLLSAWMWIAYVHRVRRGVLDDRTRFHLVAGTALPAAFLLKTALKFVFGRINTRAWMESPAVPSFLWFRGGEAHAGFPSGHMTVFAALAVAAWYFFPRARVACAALLLALGSALILTNYHFLADVIAGAYLGWAVAAVTCLALEKRAA